jgi:hypothetical protein
MTVYLHLVPKLMHGTAPSLPIMSWCLIMKHEDDFIPTVEVTFDGYGRAKARLI